MSVLSAQSIRRLCIEAEPHLPGEIIVPWARRLVPMTDPLITPFTERGVVNGKSYGLSACTYDCRIDQDLTIHPYGTPRKARVRTIPSTLIAGLPEEDQQAVLSVLGLDQVAWAGWGGRDNRQLELVFTYKDSIHTIWLDGEHVEILSGPCALASTMERFAMPHNVCGSVLDKSSLARVFVSAFNTHLDPGWEGWLTVELVNLGDTVVEYKKGDPVCQIKFEWLDEPTDLPYVGRKYSNQPARPVAAISEEPLPDATSHPEPRRAG